MKNKIAKTECITNNDKTGISLIVLVITIIVGLILIASVTISASNAIENATVVKFAKDLTEIQEATEGYYITNNSMPAITGLPVMTSSDLIAIANSRDILAEEITENDDASAQFFAIDLAKINVVKTEYGNQRYGSADIFVVAFPSMNAYYPYGVDARGTTFFSITSKISDVTKIPQNQTDTSMTSVITSAGIRVTKSSGWANQMGVNIMVDVALDESLYMSVSGDPNRLITTVTGTNSFGFNLLSSIVADNETIKVPTLTLEEANYIEAGIKPITERYVDILKYRGSDLLGKVRIDLSNFSSTLPTITSATLSSYMDINTVKLILSNSTSGIKEVRYEYLTKYTENGTIDNYYLNVTDFDSTYMKNKAKVSSVSSDLTTTINAPKNVQSIKVAVIDKAGNVNLYNQEIAPRLYIGYTLDDTSATSLQLTAKIYSINGVKSISFARSDDGINFVDEQIYTLNTTTNGTTIKQSAAFTNSQSNLEYIRMIAINYDNSISETRIIKVNLAGGTPYTGNKPVLMTGMTAKIWDTNTSSWLTVSNPDTDTSWYNYKIGRWANAQTVDGSMWVWVPRYVYSISSLWHFASPGGGAINIQFTKGINDNWNSSQIGLVNTQSVASASSSSWSNHPAFTFGGTELTGIWVAKFEASGTTNAVDIKPGVSSFRSISIDSMFTECRNMETNSRYGWGTSGTGIDTHLMKNIEWGAAAYLSQSSYGLNGVEVLKNNDASYYTGGGTGASYTTNISQSTTGNIYGIYDLSGGAWEYTAAYMSNGNANLTVNGNSLVTANNKYIDIYTVTSDTASQNYSDAVNKKGDAIFETSSPTGNATSWFSDSLSTPYGSNPFFMRGGSYTSGSDSGIFGFNINTGQGWSGISFRPTLAVDSSL